MTPPNPAPAPSASWPDGTAATAYLVRVQSLLKASGLDGTDRLFRPLVSRIAAAFKARDMADVTAGVTARCDVLVNAIEWCPGGVREQVSKPFRLTASAERCFAKRR